jgi:hypothetical protein
VVVPVLVSSASTTFNLHLVPEPEIIKQLTNPDELDGQIDPLLH